MMKPTPLKLVLAVVIGGLYYGLCANAHMDYFPCEVTERSLSTTDYQSGESYQTRSGLCSILTINRPHAHPEKAELTAAGWIVFGLSFVVAPIFVGFFIGHRIGARKAAG